MKNIQLLYIKAKLIEELVQLYLKNKRNKNHVFYLFFIYVNIFKEPGLRLDYFFVIFDFCFNLNKILKKN